MSLSVRHILCGIDFSPASVTALRVAVALARVHGAALHVVHTFVVPSSPYLDSTLASIDEERWAAALRQELLALVRAHSEPTDTIDCQVVSGFAAPALTLAARRNSADVIVIGTRGWTGLPRFLLGSVAERLVRTAPVPVLVVPEAVGVPDEHSASDKMPGRFETILCAVDFSQPSIAALNDAVALAAAHGGRLHVLHVVDPELGPEGRAASERELTEAWGRAVADARQPEVPATPAVRTGNAYREILEEALAVSASLIVVGNTGRSGHAHFLLGSVAERVMRVSSVPVLVVRR